MTIPHKIGNWGEAYALKYLETCGFYLLCSNYRWQRKEVDLILWKKDLVIFVEVKTRTSVRFGFPETFLTDHQKEGIHLAAEEFVRDHHWKGRIRFDIVAICYAKPVRLVHFTDAF